MPPMLQHIQNDRDTHFVVQESMTDLYMQGADTIIPCKRDSRSVALNGGGKGCVGRSTG